MKRPASLQSRLGISLGVLLSLLWIAAALMTAVNMRKDMDAVFDSALREMAKRILPLAVMEIVGRAEDGVTQRLAPVAEHAESLTYVVRDATGRILLQSHNADTSVFTTCLGPGYSQTETHRLYHDEVLQGTIRVSVTEPLAHRSSVAREIQIGLLLPLTIVIPLALVLIALAVRTSLDPLRRFRSALEARTERDLSPVPAEGMPTEIAPLAAALNALLNQLRAAFDAERSFAANVAHELRTPLSGAIAQAQRLGMESGDENVVSRAEDIEETLKQLARRTERLMQLARAEGGKLRSDHASDLRIAVRIVVEDMKRPAHAPDIALDLPGAPVLSPLDPDAVGILCRNLVENAIRHGNDNGTRKAEVTLTPQAELIVANDGPVIPVERVERLTDRFARENTQAEGSGLGLFIVAAIAERTESVLTLASPRPGAVGGFEARIRFPMS